MSWKVSSGTAFDIVIAVVDVIDEPILNLLVPSVCNLIVSLFANPIWVFVSPKWNIDLAIPTSPPSMTEIPH